MSTAYTVYADLPFRSASDTPLTLDLYVPSGACERPACAVFYFGGGWVEGDKKDVLRFPLFDLLLAQGVCVASANYRLCKDGGTFPASGLDGINALRYLDTQTVYPIDPERKAVFGMSAGAYLCLMASFYPVKDRPHLCAAVCLSAPPLQNASLPSSALLDGLVKTFLDGKDPHDADPANWINKNEAYPPVLLIHGQQDEIVPYAQAQHLCRTLTEKGVDASLLCVHNATHFLKSFDHTVTDPDGKTVYGAACRFIIDHI